MYVSLLSLTRGKYNTLEAEGATDSKLQRSRQARDSHGCLVGNVSEAIGGLLCFSLQAGEGGRLESSDVLRRVLAYTAHLVWIIFNALHMLSLAQRICVSRTREVDGRCGVTRLHARAANSSC
eukprot:5404845-Pleurochrysis_carterae.AAC.7